MPGAPAGVGTSGQLDPIRKPDAEVANNQQNNESSEARNQQASKYSILGTAGKKLTGVTSGVSAMKNYLTRSTRKSPDKKPADQRQQLNDTMQQLNQYDETNDQIVEE